MLVVRGHHNHIQYHCWHHTHRRRLHHCRWDVVDILFHYLHLVYIHHLVKLEGELHHLVAQVLEIRNPTVVAVVVMVVVMVDCYLDYLRIQDLHSLLHLEP